MKFYAVRGDSTSWQREVSPGTPGSVVYAIDNSATQDSVLKIPARAVVIYCELDIDVAYPGATIEIGIVGALSAFMTISENIATVANQYAVPQSVQASDTTDLVVRTTVGGAPGAGSGTVKVDYVVPVIS